MRIPVRELMRPGYAVDSDAVSLVPQAFSNVQNARFGFPGAESFAGEEAVFGTPGVAPLWLKVFPPPDAPLWVYAGLTKVYAYDGSVHTDISRTVGGPYTGNTGERWQGEAFQGVGIFNNVLDDPQMWSTFAVGTPLAALSNWPANYKCKALRSWKNFLFALHTKEAANWRPYRVRWSHPAVSGTVPASWDITDATKDAGEYDLADTKGYVVDGLALGDQFIVYKTDAVYAFQFIGAPLIFNNVNLAMARGLLWRDCVVNFKGGHFVAGVDDLYVHTGQRGSDESVVEATLRRWVYRQLDQSNYFNCFCMENEPRNEVWFCFPEVGSTYATLALVWNRRTGACGIRQLPSVPFMALGPIIPAPGTETWG